MPRPRPFARRFAALALAIGSAASVPGFAAVSAAAAVEQLDASRLLLLVEYVGADYERAVRGGVAINQLEYGEMIRFTRDAVAEYAKVARRDEEIAAALAKLAADVESRANDDAIRTASRDIARRLAERLDGVPSPSIPPDLAAGAALFVARCSSCHGVNGAGDAPLARTLEPAPVSFRGETMERLTPRHVYNSLAVGIEGTAMPSFAASTSEAERWNVAFFVMTLRDGFSPAAPVSSPPVTLEDLAASRNAEILAKLKQGDPSATASTVDYLRANAATLPLAADAGAAAKHVTGPAAMPLASTADATKPAADFLSTALHLQQAFGTAAGRIAPSVVGVASFARVDAVSAPAGRGRWQTGAMAAPDGTRPVHVGSGFVIGPEGDIATCDHLLRTEDGRIADVVRIDTTGGTVWNASVVGMEPALDLAILRIEDAQWKRPEPGLSLADSSGVRTGHWLVALGDPPGARTTFAVGVASSPAERECYQEDRSATMLQSSIEIPSEGLGGPVADIEGNVVGMGVRLPAIPESPTGPAQAGHDAILPSNLLLNLHAALTASRSTDSPWLGVSVLELGLLRSMLGNRAATLSIPEEGVLIDNVFEPSPATRAGVRAGDFLVGIGDTKVRSVADFQRALYTTGIGGKATMKLVRAATPVEVTATVEVRPTEATMR